MKPNAGIFSYASDFDTPGLEYVAGQETKIYQPVVSQIQTVKTPTGETVKIAKDTNGNTVGVKKEPKNALPIVAALAAAYFLF